MSVSRAESEPQRILSFWWMLELFSPQGVPKLTSQATRPADRQVIEWKPGSPLPWETLRQPKPLGKMRRAWQHTVFLGVYDLEATYESLHEAFGDDRDAYDERPAGRSACGGMLVDAGGRLLADSAVLSSALWAVGRIQTLGARGHGWADGFPDAQNALVEAIDEHEGRRREDADVDEPLVQDGESLGSLMRIAQEIAGVTKTTRLATETIVIQSVAVSVQRADEASDSDFLNSFFLEDLATVRTAVRKGGYGAALKRYLASDGDLNKRNRVDVIRTHKAADGGAVVTRLPKGRWPSDPKHGLSLRQQFAVNHALNDLAPTRGLMGVNGPPGTGKTTMLRDILAGNVVERARQLAALSRPEDAFTSTTHRWKTGEHSRSIRQLRPELAGFEMVVVSANNAAVENVTTEIPARNAIHSRWHDEADYFADIATEVLAEVDAQQNDEAKVQAWGLVAARLGNKRNRSAFHSAFWFDKKDPRTGEPVPDSPLRMQTRLAHWRDGSAPHKGWMDSRQDFARAERRVDELIAKRTQMQGRWNQLPQAIEVERKWIEHTARAETDLRGTEKQLLASKNSLDSAFRAVFADAAARDRHVGAKPGTLETIFSFGRAVREWRAALRPFEERLLTAEAALHVAETHLRQLEDRAGDLRQGLRDAETGQAQATEFLANLRCKVDTDKVEIGPSYPDEAWVREARELYAPWLDDELDAARSDLFLAALQLHQDFLANTARDMTNGLRAALEIVAGGGPRNLEPEKRRAAWQLFFMVVPLVSTTFASLGRMFGDIGPESVGWVLVDEAGQAPPQYAAGAVWRAQRVVSVGDPLQLQPVVTIPPKAQRDIASAYGVSETWMPPQASVQTLADRVSRHGTTLQQGDQHVWVSAPLTVHRRCDDPMFGLCNDLAYNGIMVNGVKRQLDDPDEPDLFDSVAGPIVVRSHWVDEPSLTQGTHLQENQIARLERALAYLDNQGIGPDQVIAISPFRAVADRLVSLSQSYPGLTAGTIHTAQGREASVVFLILGGDPASPGSKAWAASSVNLVNVAASRAMRRLYVIGDRSAWAKHNYFHQLAAYLNQHPRT